MVGGMTIHNPPPHRANGTPPVGPTALGASLCGAVMSVGLFYDGIPWIADLLGVPGWVGHLVWIFLFVLPMAVLGVAGSALVWNRIGARLRRGNS